MSAPTPPAGRLARLLPGVLFVALVVALYASPLFVRRNFSGRDLIAYNLPMEKSIHDAYARGRLPVWTPEISGGRPLMPNPNAGALYPVRALLSPLPFPLAARIQPVLHWAAAGLGVLALLLSIGRSRPAAWIGAVTYVFSGVVVSEAFFPHIQPGMALLPWILWAVARPAAAPWHRLLPVAALFALDFFAADIFTCAIAIGSAALWIAIESDRATRLRELATLVVGVALGALAAAPQIVATALWIPLTNRAVLGMKLSDAVYFSIHPLRLLELVIPYPFGPAWEMTHGTLWGWPLFRGRAMGIFDTLYCGAFAVIAVGASWKLRERGARFGRALLLVSLAFAVPPGLVPIGWAAGIPSPLPLRNPEKLAVAVVLAFAILAAFGFDAYCRSARRPPRWTLAVGALLALAAVFAAAAPGAAAGLAVRAIGGNPAVVGARAQSSLPLALAEAGLLWMASVVAIDLVGRPGRGALTAAVVLLTLVPIEANRRIARSFREEAVFGETAFARLVQKRDPAGEYRTLGEAFFLGTSPLSEAAADSTLLYSDSSRRAWTHNTPVLWGRGTVINEDFDVGDLSRTESLRRVSGFATGFQDSAAFFGSLALRWGIRYKDQRAIAGYTRFGGDGLQEWDEHARAYPDIRLLERWSEAPGAVAALQAVPRLGEGEVVVESGGASAGRARPGSVRVVEKTAERMALDLDAADAGWLFVLRAHWPYRRILLDGKPVEAVPAQLAFSAVPVPAGKHRLTWEERVPGLAVSAWGPVLFGMIAIGYLVARTRWRPRPA